MKYGRLFTSENTALDREALDRLNRAARIYLFGTTKKSLTRDDLSRLRSAFKPDLSATQIADELHHQDNQGELK